MESVPGAVPGSLRGQPAWGGGCDRVTIPAILILATNCDPVAIAPGTDLFSLVWSNQIEVPSRTFYYQSIRIVFIILATKLSVIHEPKVHAPASLFIQR